MQHRDASHISPVALGALNLDLVELSGGGNSPAIFIGKTHDGQALRCTYDDGYLRIRSAADASPTAFKNAKTLRARRVGPKIHGYLTLGQMCHVAGLTIQGVLPPLLATDVTAEQDWLDFSGDTKYYSARLHSSAETYQTFITDLLAKHPRATICVLDDDGGGNVLQQGEALTARDSLIVLGPHPNPAEIADFIAAVHKRVFVPAAFPGRVIVRVMALDLDATYRKRPLKRWPLNPQYPDNGYLMFDPPPLWIEGVLASADTAGQSDLARLETLLLGHYPIYRMAHFDPISGKAKPIFDYSEHLDPRQVADLRANPQLSYLNSHRDGFDCVVRPFPL